MITVKFSGGLGNQMFEYAFYYSLKKAYTKKLAGYSNMCNKLIINADLFHYYVYNDFNKFELLDIFDLKLNTYNYFEFMKHFYLSKNLHASNIIFSKNHHSLKNLYVVSMEKLRYYVISMNYIYLGPKVRNYNHQALNVDESYYQTSRYDKTFFYLDKTKNFYLDGFWQNCNYFIDYSDELLNKFRFKNELNKKNKKLVNLINKSNSVSIHVRRGDFVDLNWNINMDYYKKAIDIIYKNIINPIFYIFSDDDEFVKNHFKDLENKIIVNNNKGKYSYIDMQLMSLCKYNIIANSTFSTWGAILNKNKNKIVIAPKMIKYFESHILSKDSKYIYI